MHNQSDFNSKFNAILCTRKLQSMIPNDIQIVTRDPSTYWNTYEEWKANGYVSRPGCFNRHDVRFLTNTEVRDDAEDNNKTRLSALIAHAHACDFDVEVDTIAVDVNGIRCNNSVCLRVAKGYDHEKCKKAFWDRISQERKKR